MATLTTTVILQKVIAYFAAQHPMITQFSHEFTTERLKLNQQAIAHILVKPTASSYDANNGGYKAGANSTRDLLVDVPMVMDQHKHVTVKLSHLNALADQKVPLMEFFQGAAQALGEGFTDYVLSKVNSRNFSNYSTFTTGNSDKDMLSEMRKKMNIQGARMIGRFGLVNSDVMETLDNDSRISNRYDDRSQQAEANTVGRLINVSGFGVVQEDPLLPTNNGSTIALSGIAATGDLATSTAAHGLVVGDRVTFPTLGGGGAGLTAVSTIYYVIAVPSTTTFQVSATEGGSAVDITTNYTASTVQLAENVKGFFASEEAIAFKTGIPTDSLEAARAFGIPTPVSDEIVTDPTSGISMVGYKWFEPGTMDAYMTLALIYGAVAGKQGGSAGTLMDKAGRLLRSA